MLKLASLVLQLGVMLCSVVEFVDHGFNYIILFQVTIRKITE